MRKDYRSVIDVNGGEMKRFLLKINKNKKIQDELINAMNDKRIKKVVENHNAYFFKKAQAYLKESQNYDELEYRLIIMNQLFDNNSYQKDKKELLQRLCQKTITVNEYCIIRHLIPINKKNFKTCIHILNEVYHVNLLNCARICLLEDDYKEAYQFLLQLDECHDDVVLDLLVSNSVPLYISLMKNYQNKQKGYVLMPTH